jgi:septal ring factor EnvC (AmiA/AmiB activator)
MTGIATTLIAVIGALGGTSAIIVSLLYFKENKRRKQAETKSIDIEALTNTIEVLQEDKEKMRKEVNDMRKEIDTLKTSLRVSDAEKIGIERDLNIYKRAVGCRVQCDREQCPIELKLDVLSVKKEAMHG